MDHLVEASVLTPAFLCRVQVRMEERLRRWQAGVPLPWLAVGRPGQVRQDPTGPTIPHFFLIKFSHGSIQTHEILVQNLCVILYNYVMFEILVLTQ